MGKLRVQKEITEKVINIESIYLSFQTNMNSVHFYFSKFGGLASNEDETIATNQNVFLEETLKELTVEVDRLKAKRKDPDDEAEEVQIDQKSKEVFSRILRNSNKQSKISPKNYEILSRGSFLMLNNYFEYLLVDLLTYFYTKFQSTLNTKEFKVSLQELGEYENIQEVIKHLILKEVESILVEKTFDQLLEHFDKYLKVSLEKEIIDWDKILELRERRHLIVHNSSIVNKKYISRTKNPYNLNIGDTIQITSEYFFESFKQLDFAGKILSFNCWGNWDTDNATEGIKQIMLASFESVNKKDYDTTIKYCKYSNQIQSKTSEQQDYLLRTQINKAIALKKQSKKSELSKLLRSLPLGTASPIFKVAYLILEDEQTNLLENFKKAILVDNLTMDNYLEWPIFEFVRENKELHPQLIEQFNKG